MEWKDADGGGSKSKHANNVATGTGLLLDMIGGAASLTAKELEKPKHAVRGQNLATQAKVLKTSRR
jgi:hypothetical protein